MMAKSFLIVWAMLILFPGIIQAQTCQNLEIDSVCNNSAPIGAWLSNIAYTPRNDGSIGYITWHPDSQKTSDYVLFIRAPPHNNITGFQNISDMITDLNIFQFELDTNYEALVCYAGTQASRHGLYKECGFCSTCFQIMKTDFIEVITTTRTRVIGSRRANGYIYFCRAIGNPLPTMIISVMRKGERINLTADTQASDFDFQINSSADEVVGEVRTYRNRDHRLVSFIIYNGNRSETRTNKDFLVTSTIRIRASPTSSTTTITETSITLNNKTEVVLPEMGINFPILVVIPIGSVAVFCIVLSIVVCVVYRHCAVKRSKMRHKAINGRQLNVSRIDKMVINRMVVDEPSTVSKVRALRDKIPKDMIVIPSALNVSLVIGQGQFGVIYKAYWTQENIREVVAVKTLKGIFATDNDIENAMEEILKMRHFDHINVMPLLGVCLAPSSHDSASAGPSLVMPFMERGSLLDYIRKEAEKLFLKAEDENYIVKRKLVQMCMQIARGMEYLASLKFIHRDLAARNCLMDSNGTIKVSDFGLTENVYSRNYFRQVKEGEKLPLKWMALESIKLGVFTEKTDVWSFGVTCWEVYSGGAIPFPGIHPQDVLPYLEERGKLPKPKNEACSTEIYDMLLSCWEIDEDSRPNFSEIVYMLEEYLTASSDYIDLRDITVTTK